jgi:uncharacterized membrane protein
MPGRRRPYKSAGYKRAVTHYNRIAGQSVERLAALSDGVFAVAMTLLVLDLRAPTVDTIHSDHDLWHAVVALSPRLLMYVSGWGSRRS